MQTLVLFVYPILLQLDCSKIRTVIFGMVIMGGRRLSWVDVDGSRSLLLNILSN